MFYITSGHYLRAAELASLDGETTLGMFAIYNAAAGRHRIQAWYLFEELFLGDQLSFDSHSHCVVALLMMAAICEDEENEEEGQL